MALLIRLFFAGVTGAVLISAPAYWGSLALLGEPQAITTFKSGGKPLHEVLLYSIPAGAALGFTVAVFVARSAKSVEVSLLKAVTGWVLAVLVSYPPAFLWTMINGFSMPTALSATVVSASFPLIVLVVAIAVAITMRRSAQSS